MKYLILLTLLGLAACKTGDDVTYTTVVSPSDASIVNVWTAQDPLSRVPSLDFHFVTPNFIEDIVNVLNCDVPGQPDISGTSPAINGVGKNQFKVTGSLTSGLIQFGPLSHADQLPSNVCYTVGQEQFAYTISGKTMTLCDAKYSSCSVYTTN